MVEPTNEDKPIPLGRVYGSPSEGQKALQSRYEYWTAKITDYSFQACISLIAANWAVHSNETSGLVSNGWATLSIVFALLAILISLVGALSLANKHYRLFYEAETNKAEWEERWKDSETNEASPWPFSHEIVLLGKMLAHLKVWLPVLGGLFFIVGVFC